MNETTDLFPSRDVLTETKMPLPLNIVVFKVYHTADLAAPISDLLGSDSRK